LNINGNPAKKNLNHYIQFPILGDYLGKAGKVLLIIGIIGLVIGVLLMISLPVMLMMTYKDSSEYDDWVGSASAGDEEDFTGEIDEKEKEELLGVSWYVYTFKDADVGFVCSNDIGDKGDTVYVTIEYDEILGMPFPEATNYYYLWICALPGCITSGVFGILLVIGIILVVTGKKKEGQMQQQQQQVVIQNAPPPQPTINQYGRQRPPPPPPPPRQGY